MRIEKKIPVFSHEIQLCRLEVLAGDAPAGREIRSRSSSAVSFSYTITGTICERAYFFKDVICMNVEWLKAKYIQTGADFSTELQHACLYACVRVRTFGRACERTQVHVCKDVTERENITVVMK